MAIVYDYPGVTRDRLYTRAHWGNTEFVVVDTGGLMGDASKLDAAISAAAMHAISAGTQYAVPVYPATDRDPFSTPQHSQHMLCQNAKCEVACNDKQDAAS